MSVSVLGCVMLRTAGRSQEQGTGGARRCQGEVERDSGLSPCCSVSMCPPGWSVCPAGEAIPHQSLVWTDF